MTKQSINIMNKMNQSIAHRFHRSFSSTGAMEAAHAISTGNLVSLSEQQLIDCEPTNLGCNGGLTPNAFSWITNGPGMVCVVLSLCRHMCHTYHCAILLLFFIF